MAELSFACGNYNMDDRSPIPRFPGVVIFSRVSNVSNVSKENGNISNVSNASKEKAKKRLIKYPGYRKSSDPPDRRDGMSVFVIS